jgi:hypothetical protein
MLLIVAMPFLSRAQTSKEGLGSAPKPLSAPAAPTPKSTFTQLRTALGAIKPGVQVTEEMKTSLFNALMEIVESKKQPSQDTVKKLVDDLAQALPSSRMTATERYAIAKDLQEVMNSFTTSASQVETALRDVHAILLATGVPSLAIEAVLADLQAIKAEVQKPTAAAKSKAQGKTLSTPGAVQKSR